MSTFTTREYNWLVIHAKTIMDNEKNTYENPTQATDEELWFAASAADNTTPFDAMAAYERFQQRTGLTKHAQRPYKQWFYYAAAVVALLVIVSVTSYYQGGRQMERSFADIVVEAPLGSKTKMVLPDGTEVWLNAGSRMVYSQGFGMTDRRLEFEGEGFFEVKKNAKLPFAIHTRELDVTVLGTKFNFRNYPEDETAVVDLLEGKVALDNHVQPMETRYLAPAEKMVLNKATGEMEIIAAEVEKAKIWTDDVLLFDEEFLPDIAVQLERYYDVKIILANPALETARFYGRFNRQTQSIYDVLNILSSTGRVSYVVKGDTIILK